MKLNNKGFAISVILYAMVILIMGIMYLLLDVLNDRYRLSKQAKEDVVEYINSQGVNTISDEYTNKLATTKLIKTGELIYQSFGNYYYEGNSPNNFVNFNSELWRIIGVISINKVRYVKLIRYESLGEETVDNYKIVDSDLFTYLNGDYYTSLNGSKNMLAKVNWTNSAFSTNVTPLNAYNQEVAGDSAVNNYVGLPNPSDFGFVASESYHSLRLNDYASSINDNWLSLATNYFTMSYSGVNLNIVNVQGNLESVTSKTANVYPCVYLKKDILITSGDGSSTNPYILSNS